MAIHVLQIEPIGGHRGMHYYDFNLCNALLDQGVRPRLLTSDETKDPTGAARFEMQPLFRSIYGREPSWQRGLNYVRALRAIGKRQPHPGGEVAHLHYFLVPPIDYLFIRRLKAKGFRVVITAHDIVPFNRQPSALLGAIYRLADRVIVHAQANRDELISTFHVPPEHIQVIPHGNYTPSLGPLLSQQEAKGALGLGPDTPMVLFFGQIKRVKGLDYLLRAFPAVLNSLPNAKLVVSGPIWKDHWPRYLELIAELGIEGHVLSRIQHIPDGDVATYFCAADVVALPYLKIYQSGVLLMACSYGRPVVATATGGMPEILRDGETGFLVPPRDPEALGAALIRMLSDHARAEEMGARARYLVETEYSWATIAAKTRSVYAEVLGLGGGADPSGPQGTSPCA